MRRLPIKGFNRSFSSQVVFDRSLKLKHRQNTVNNVDHWYIHRECAERLVDRLDDISRVFPLGLDISCHAGHIQESLRKRDCLLDPEKFAGGISTLVQCDISSKAIDLVSNRFQKDPKLDTHALVADEEHLPFEDNSYDIVLSSMGLHWVNNIPGVLSNVNRILKPDGVFIGCMLGGSTLEELKRCFYLAETERKGGLGYHLSPMVQASDIAGLMQGAGFALPTIDVDTIQIGYPNAFVLMEHLKAMGENTAFLGRTLQCGKDTMLAMATIYQGTHWNLCP